MSPRNTAAAGHDDRAPPRDSVGGRGGYDDRAPPRDGGGRGGYDDRAPPRDGGGGRGGGGGGRGGYDDQGRAPPRDSVGGRGGYDRNRIPSREQGGLSERGPGTGEWPCLLPCLPRATPVACAVAHPTRFVVRVWRLGVPRGGPAMGTGFQSAKGGKQRGTASRWNEKGFAFIKYVFFPPQPVRGGCAHLKPCAATLPHSKPHTLLVRTVYVSWRPRLSTAAAICIERPLLCAASTALGRHTPR